MYSIEKVEKPSLRGALRRGNPGFKSRRGPLIALSA